MSFYGVRVNQQQPPYPPNSHQAPYPLYPSRQEDGAWSWGIGLLALICIPGLGALGAGIAMAVIGRMQLRKGGIASQNGRNAANWGLTYALATLLLAGLHTFTLWYFTRGEPVKDFLPLGSWVVIWVLLTLFHLGYCLYAAIKAGKGAVVKSPPSIRFFR